MASTFIKLPLSGGGGGGGSGVNSFNGRTGNVVSQSGDYSASIVSNTPAGSVSATTVQAAINELDSEKQALITGAASTITSSNLPINRAAISNASGKMDVSTVTSTELGQLSGVTSNIQTQLNAKEPTISILPISKGGTNASSAQSARSSLNIDQRSSFSNINYTILSTDRSVAQVGVMTAPRTVTLPPANSVNPGQTLFIYDQSGTVSTTNTITIQRSGADTINGATSTVIRAPYGLARLISDGVGSWNDGTLGVSRGGTGLTTLPNNGQLLIGNGTTQSYQLSTLTAGSGISIINTPGGILITNSASSAFVNIDGGNASTLFGGTGNIDAGNAI